MPEPGDGCGAARNDTSLIGNTTAQEGTTMNISISSTGARALVATAALGIAFAGGVVTGRAADATPRQQATASAVERVQPVAPVYYVIDTRDAALETERAASITAQERVLMGIVAPRVDVRFLEDNDAGRMTAMEAVLVAQ
jgi:hypothetical protein